MDSSKHYPRNIMRNIMRNTVINTVQSNRCLMPLLISFLTLIASGCTQNPYLGGAAWQRPSNVVAMTPADAQISELQRRAQLVDDDNRQLQIQMAQTEQKAQVFKDEADLLRTQLADVSQQLASSRIAKETAESQVKGFQATTQLRGNATIRANTDLAKQAARLNLGGIPIEKDRDVVRVVIPADQVFQPGTAQIHAQAAQVLDPIAAQVRAVFPRQRIGIESYTDNAQIYGGSVATSHQLTSAQALAVLDFLTRRSGVPGQQLFTVAQGSNNPRQSNETPAGRVANRRIELVIYPDTF